MKNGTWWCSPNKLLLVPQTSDAKKISSKAPKACQKNILKRKRGKPPRRDNKCLRLDHCCLNTLATTWYNKNYVHQYNWRKTYRRIGCGNLNTVLRSQNKIWRERNFPCPKNNWLQLQHKTYYTGCPAKTGSYKLHHLCQPL